MEVNDKDQAFQHLLDTIHSYQPDAPCDDVKKAFNLAEEAHKDQRRASGEPYIIHPLAVAQILADMKIDTKTITASLLHDVVEDTSYTLDDLKQLFGKEVAFLVDGVTKLSRLNYRTKEDQQLNSMRKMFLAMAKDVRVVVIKLADRRTFTPCSLAFAATETESLRSISIDPTCMSIGGNPRKSPNSGEIYGSIRSCSPG